MHIPKFVPGIGDTHMTVDVVVGVVIPEEQQEVVRMWKYIQWYNHSEEHGHPGALQPLSW
jgi:hypothetical protein